MNDQAFDVGHLGLGALPVDRAFVGLASPASYQAHRSEPAFSGHAGLGQIFRKETADYQGGNVGISIINQQIAGDWVPVANSDGSGSISANDPTGQLDIAGDLKDALGQHQVIGELISTWTSGKSRHGGYIYFGLNDPHGGAAQTPGEPPGMAIMRISKSSGTYQIEMCTSNATRVVPMPPMPAPYTPPVAPAAAAAAAAATDNTIWYVLLGLTVVGVGGYLLLE